MLFTCLNLLPPIGFEQRIYDILQYIEGSSTQFNNQFAAIMKKDKTGYGSIEKAFTILNKMYTLNELGDNITDITSKFYSMGRLCDIRSPYFFITVFGDGSIKIFNPEYTGNVRALNDNNIIDLRRNMLDNIGMTYYNNIWTETELTARAWQALQNIIIFRGSYQYKFGDNVSYKGINYYVVGREYNQELEDVINYGVLLVNQKPETEIVPISSGLGAGIINQEEDSLQGYLEFSNGLRINYIKGLGISGTSGSGFSQAFWTFPKPFSKMYFGGGAVPIDGRTSWHQCMVLIVPQYTNDYRTSCKFVCRGRDDNTWITRYNAFVIGI